MMVYLLALLFVIVGSLIKFLEYTTNEIALEFRLPELNRLGSKIKLESR